MYKVAQIVMVHMVPEEPLGYEGMALIWLNQSFFDTLCSFSSLFSDFAITKKSKKLENSKIQALGVLRIQLNFNPVER